MYVSEVYYGRAGKVLVGGPATPAGIPDPLEDTTADRKRLPTDLEPVAFHGTSLPYWFDTLTCSNAKAVIDLCCTDGVLALACAVRGVPYLGITFTEEGKSFLIDHLVHQIFSVHFLDENGPLYQPGLAEIIAKKRKEEGKKKSGNGAPQKKRKKKDAKGAKHKQATSIRVGVLCFKMFYTASDG